MTDFHENVTRHYTVGGLESRILGALAAAGKDLDALTPDDLMAIDFFHIRGRVATEELAAWAQLDHRHRVLDVGCGIGGTSRFLAGTYGCSSVGIDVTPEYCRVAESLSARVGLADRTEFHVGSALDLPFPDGSFDVVWTEHVQMNIADKNTFYGEMTRVLKDDGSLLFHDVFAGSNGPPHYPVPWASDASISHLVSFESVVAILEGLGFKAEHREDKTDESGAFFHKALERVHRRDPAPVGMHLLTGESTLAQFENLLRNLTEGRVRVYQTLMRRNRMDVSPIE